MPTLVERTAQMHLMALCHDCRRFHEIETPLHGLVARLDDWHQKHTGHNIEFISRYRHIPAKLDDKAFQEHNYTPWYLDYKPNDDIKLKLSIGPARRPIVRHRVTMIFNY